MQLIFEFYEVYLKNAPKDNIDSFEHFMQWAQIAIQDFNEVDRHLLDTQDFFGNLQDIQRMRNWDVTDSEIDNSTLVQNILLF